MSMKMKDIKPFALRMPPTMRESLERVAAQNRRSLNQELIERLAVSLRNAPAVGERATVLKTGMPEAAAYRLSELETAMLLVLKGMSVEKQLALLSLFK